MKVVLKNLGQALLFFPVFLVGWWFVHAFPRVSLTFAALFVGYGVVLGVQWFRADRAVRRLRRGLCPLCGYDMRATPYRCSECGFPHAVST